jgi:hypothetical protein
MKDYKEEKGKFHAGPIIDTPVGYWPIKIALNSLLVLDRRRQFNAQKKYSHGLNIYVFFSKQCPAVRSINYFFLLFNSFTGKLRQQLIKVGDINGKTAKNTGKILFIF